MSKAKKLTIDDERLSKIRKFIVDNIMRNEAVVLSDTNYEYDVVDIIANLYEYLHQIVTGESYDYMWHWCNKAGGWCNTYLMDDKIDGGVNL